MTADLAFLANFPNQRVKEKMNLHFMIKRTFFILGRASHLAQA